MTLTLSHHVTIVDAEHHGMVLLDERTGTYYQLNATGAEVVRALREGDGPDSAVAALRRRHPQAAERIAGDVEQLVQTLREAQVIGR
jgi:hypothetical protein